MSQPLPIQLSSLICDQAQRKSLADLQNYLTEQCANLKIGPGSERSQILASLAESAIWICASQFFHDLGPELLIDFEKGLEIETKNNPKITSVELLGKLTMALHAKIRAKLHKITTPVKDV